VSDVQSQSEAALDTLFAEGDADEAFEDISAKRVAEAIRESDELRTYFDQLARLDRSLADEDSNFERAFSDALMETRLDDAFGGSDEDERAEVISLFGGRPATAGLLAAALAVGLFGIIWLVQPVLNGSGQGERGTFRARSAASASDSVYPEPDLEVFCARRDERGVRFAGSTDDSLGVLTCPNDGEIKIAYRNHAPELGYVVFFGVDAEGTYYWYGPTPAAKEPVQAERSDDLVPHGESIRLEVNHRPGRLRIHAVFTTEPIDFDSLNQRLEAADGTKMFERPSVNLLGLPEAATSEMIEITSPDKDREAP
jgi:hypothetical protein